MNTSTDTHRVEEVEKTPISVKILAILGFFASVALIVWLVIFATRSLPGAFDSLADSFATIRNYEEPTDLTIATGKNIVNTKESFTVAWTHFSVPGTYTFSYTCTEGISLDIRSGTEVTTLPCDEPFTLPGDVQTIDIIASSEKNRFSEVPFMVTFTSTDSEIAHEKEARITVVNASIPQGHTEVTERETTEVSNEPTYTKPSAYETTTKPAPSTTPTPYFPTSNPHGSSDLSVTYLGIGVVENGRFIARGAFDEDERGALRFMIENKGTKTSDTFTYSVELPGNDTYRSETEIPLKPRERAFYTVSFSVPEKDASEHIVVEVHTTSDAEDGNNSFDWFVKITE